VSGALRFAPVRWPADADALGFTADPRGERVRNGSVLRSEGGWLAVAMRKSSVGNPWGDLLGAPGLWRGLRERSLRAAPKWNLVFDLPPLLSPETPEEVAAEHPCRALVCWAEATLDGSAPRGWTPPERAEVEDWAPPVRRGVRAGAEVAQIDLVVEPKRFALVIPALARVPAELPPARLGWLEEICCDAQERWRMVRFGIDRTTSSVRAEVDLTGAPSDRARPLAELALAALRCSAEWALPALSLATDSALTTQLLDDEPRWVSSRLTKEERTDD
jgi:hypothetical protein